MQMQPRGGMQPRHRTQHRAMPPVPPPPPEKKKRRRFSFVRTLLMLIGLGTVLVLAARYVIVPLLVMLPQWLEGVV